MSILKFAQKYLKRVSTDKKDKPAESAGVAKKSMITKPKAKKAGKAKPRKIVSGQETKLDLWPLVTEKGVRLQEQGFVVFRVPTKTTKGQVKQAVRAKYNVNPISIRSLRVAPKKRRRGTTVGKTSGWKKVYVKVDDIQKIVTRP